MSISWSYLCSIETTLAICWSKPEFRSCRFSRCGLERLRGQSYSVTRSKTVQTLSIPVENKVRWFLLEVNYWDSRERHTPLRDIWWCSTPNKVQFTSWTFSLSGNSSLTMHHPFSLKNP